MRFAGRCCLGIYKSGSQRIALDAVVPNRIVTNGLEKYCYSRL